MSNRTSIIVRILIVVALTAFFVWANKNARDNQSRRYAEMLHDNFTGVVLSKEKHKVTCFTIYRFNDKVEKRYIFSIELTDMLSVGDTIIKKKDDSLCHIFNATTHRFAYVKFN